MIISHVHEGITYTFNITKRKGQKRIIIKPTSPNVFKVTCPKYSTKKQIHLTITEHIDTLKRLKPILNYNDYLHTVTTLIIFDKSYPIVTKVGKVNEAYLIDDKVHLTLKSDRHKGPTLKSFLKMVLLNEVKIIEQDFKNQTLINLDNITYQTSYLKSKFGSCEVTKKVIKFNMILVHYPRAYLEYIYAHEIAHLKEPNHSKAFYNVLTQLSKEHKALKKALNSHHTAFITHN